MKKLFLLIIVGIGFLSGCAENKQASLEEAYYMDREFGKGSLAAWNQQIVHPDREIDKVPTGREGVIAEEVIDVHIKTFGEKPTEINTFSLEIN